MKTKFILSGILMALLFACESSRESNSEIENFTVATGYCSCEHPRSAIRFDKNLNVLFYTDSTNQFYKGIINKKKWDSIVLNIYKYIDFKNLDTLTWGADGQDIELVVNFKNRKYHLVGQGGNLPDSTMKLLLSIAHFNRELSLKTTSKVNFETKMQLPIILPKPAPAVSNGK